MKFKTEAEFCNHMHENVRYESERLSAASRYGLLTKDDLYQVGMIGVIEAYRNKNKGFGNGLVRYAKIRAIGNMIDELRKLSPDTRKEFKEGNYRQLSYLSEYDNVLDGDGGGWENYLSGITGGTASAEDVAISHQNVDRIQKVINKRSKSHQSIIYNSIRGYSNRECSDKSNVTDSRVCQILTGLKKEIKEKILI